MGLAVNHVQLVPTAKEAVSQLLRYARNMLMQAIHAYAELLITNESFVDMCGRAMTLSMSRDRSLGVSVPPTSCRASGVPITSVSTSSGERIRNMASMLIECMPVLPLSHPSDGCILAGTIRPTTVPAHRA